MPTDSRDKKFREIVDRYVADRRLGKTPDKKEIAKQNPELAEDLGKEFKRIELLLQAHDNLDAVDITRAQAVVSTNRTLSLDSSTREKRGLLTPRVRDDKSDRLQVRCPECSQAIEIVTDTPWTTITCDSCNTIFNLAGADTGPEQSLAQIGHFEVHERVGMGAFGTVWRAYDPDLDRQVAIKIPRKGQLTEAESEHFLREARAAAQIRHPNIVRVYEVGRHDDRVFIASDFIEGVTLDEHLTDFRLTIRESARLIRTLAAALQVAHEAGVVHRDLKPGNILLDREMQPHITDFGLAKRDSGDVTMTLDGAIMGTPAYMSPEQALGQAHTADRRTDVYSIGVVLFELLTGARPFRGNTRMMINQVINEEPPNPVKLNSNIDRDLATITLKCLEKEPDKRYQSGELLSDDLNRYLESKPIHARPVSRLERSWRWCKRKPALAAALALSTLLVSTLAIVGPIFAYQEATLRKRSDDVLQIVTDSFKSTDPDLGSDAQMTVEDVVINLEDNLRKSELDDEGRVQLLQTLTSIFLGLGVYDKAVKTALEEVNIRMQMQGENHPDTLRAMNMLANAYRFAGLPEDAYKLGEKTRGAQIEILGLNNADTLATMNYLASAYRYSGRLMKAIDLYEQTLKLRQKFLKPEGHPDTLASMNNLANAYRENSDYAKALELCKETVAAMEKALPSDHPDLLTAMNSLASAYYSVGRGNEAHDLYEKTLDARKKKLGLDHPNTLISMHNLALSYSSRNKLREAIELYEQTVDARKKRLGADHSDTLASMSNLAKCYLDSGQHQEALKLREKIVAAWKSNQGVNDSKTVVSIGELSKAMDVAVRHVQDLIVVAQYQNAVELLDSIMAVKEQDKNQQKKINQNLLIVQMAQEKCAEAQKSISKWINLLDSNDRKQIVWAKASQAVCLAQQREYAEAEELANEALECPELTPFDRNRCNGVLGVCLANQNEFELAEAKVVDSFNELKEMLEEIPPHLRWYIPHACQRVVQVYEMWGKSDEIEKWSSKLEKLRAEISKLNESIIFVHQAQNIFGDTWSKVAPTPADDKTVLTEQELRLMREVCVQHPKGLHFMTLGVAEFRMENFSEAIAAANESLRRTPQEEKIKHVYPGDLAILAMSYMKRNDQANAKKYRSQLSEAMKVKAFTNNQECQSFAAEVNELFDSESDK